MDLQNKTILVTGSSSGIGQAIAVACAQKGAIVLIHYRKNEQGAKETLEEVTKHSQGHIFQANLTEQQQLEKLFQNIEKENFKIDALINNAGQYKVGDFFDNKVWEFQFNNIFFSAIHTTQHFLKQNTNAPLRKVINITSYYGTEHGGNSDSIAYSSAKAALASVTRTQAKMDSRVQVNAIAPGYVWTPVWEGISDEHKKLCKDRTMINRYIEPTEIAHATIYLLENDAITGQVIEVDGGLSLQKLDRK